MRSCRRRKVSDEGHCTACLQIERLGPNNQMIHESGTNAENFSDPGGIGEGGRKVVAPSVDREWRGADGRLDGAGRRRVHVYIAFAELCVDDLPLHMQRWGALTLGLVCGIVASTGAPPIPVHIPVARIQTMPTNVQM